MSSIYLAGQTQPLQNEASIDFPRPDRLVTGNPERLTYSLYEHPHMGCGIWQCEVGAWNIQFADNKQEFFQVIEGIVFVIEKFVEYFELAGYVFVSDNATLTFYQGWINRLSISKISGKIQQEVVLTPEIASQISKLEDLARQDLIIFNFLDKEPKENRSSLTGLLIEEFGLKDLVKKIFWYADFGSGGGKGSLKHFKESLKSYSDKDMDFDAIFKKRNIEI